MVPSFNITGIRHPQYSQRFNDWIKWRDTYEGGNNFIQKYLKTFSSRESAGAFQKRLAISYNPAFAKQGVEEIKNSIFQRLVDISRKGGSKTYHTAIDGQEGGVDLLGSSMSSFLGRKLLHELLVMARVGIYVDMPPVDGPTLADSAGKRPYIYLYKAEDICSWVYDEGSNSNEFTNLLLKDYYYTYNPQTGLPKGSEERFRHIWVAEGEVFVQYYDTTGEKVNVLNVRGGEETVIALQLKRIPFVLPELSNSILADVCNYQIAHLNLASSDMAYALHANFPFYTEQYDPRATNEFARPVGAENTAQEVKVGPQVGRRYPIGTERPQFIHPSSEPLRISMDKQEQLKLEIRELISLSISNLVPKMASAASKGMDQQGLEAGLSYIGLELENTERKIAEFWAIYEKGTIATVNYPQTYSIKTPEERRKEAADLKELLPTVPSRLYQKKICCRIAELTIGREVTTEELSSIYDEINKSKGMTADPTIIAKHVEVGFLDLDLAAEISGYPPGTVEKAAGDQAQRLARISEAQTPANGLVNGAARGVAVLDPNPLSSASAEKSASVKTITDPVVKDKTRGPGAVSPVRKG